MIVTKDKSIIVKVNELLSKVTIEEKVGQMNQYNGFWNVSGPIPKDDTSQLKYEHLKKGWVGSMLNVRGTENVRSVQRIAVEESRLGIPLIIGFDVIHRYKTLSPILLAEAASWDLKAIEKSSRTAAIEASAAGINWTFAPMVDVSRDVRWGRVMEGAGEDPYLGAEIAKARVKGFELVPLKSGETKTIAFSLSKKELGFFNNDGNFIIEPGDFEVFIGGDSANTIKKFFSLI